MLAAGALFVRRAPRVSREPGLSVLLISIDTLRFDGLGSYGQAQAGTPWMDRLAQEGARFERAYAHNVVALPSHANILAGRYPSEHGVRDNAVTLLETGDKPGASQALQRYLPLAKGKDRARALALLRQLGGS